MWQRVTNLWQRVTNLWQRNFKTLIAQHFQDLQNL